MSEEYLWDRSGEPDPEVRRLEELLSPFRDSGPRSDTRRWLWPVLAIAASLAVAAVIASHKPASAWRLAADDGRSEPLTEGQTIDTHGSDTAILQASAIGELKLDPGSQLRVGRSGVALHRGVLHALIWAPPAKFVVETPSAQTVDLGCAYRLAVQPDGSGLLSVTLGWVAFQSGEWESFIPAGAECRTRPRTGPGVPYFEDAPANLRSALAKFEQTGGPVDLDEILASARKRDALTLWHLLLRTKGPDRRRVAEAFLKRVPGAEEAGLERGDHRALDAAWNSLELGDTGWWRTWKQRW